MSHGEIYVLAAILTLGFTIPVLVVGSRARQARWGTGLPVGQITVGVVVVIGALAIAFQGVSSASIGALLATLSAAIALVLLVGPLRAEDGRIKWLFGAGAVLALLILVGSLVVATR
jgi:hypothetical protein